HTTHQYSTSSPKTLTYSDSKPTPQNKKATFPTATPKNIGCRRSSQNRQPALNNPTKPSPARTCGSTHQLGVSRAAIIDKTPTGFGSVLIGTIIKPLSHSVVNSAAAGKNLGSHYEAIMKTIDVGYV